MFMKGTPFSREQMMDAALNTANRFRLHLGLSKLDTLVGRCGKSYSACGIANAVNHGLEGAPYFVMNNTTIEGVKIITLHEGDPNATFRASTALHTVESDEAWYFVQNFDYGKFPELAEEFAA